MMPTVLAFDVNETLLDLRALDPLFEAVLGDPGLRPQWFNSMLQLAFVGGLTGRYVDFSSTQRAVLRMTAARAEREVTDDDVHRVVDAMRRLPAHPEVPQALNRLRADGFRLMALTNSVVDVAQAQLAHAQLTDLFDGVFSADEVRVLKPAPALPDGCRTLQFRSGISGSSPPTPGTSPEPWPPVAGQHSWLDQD